MLSEELRSLGDECGSSEMNQPLVTPYTEASRQDIQSEIIPQVSDPLPPETNESIIPAIRQSQRSTKGIGKKQYEPDLHSTVNYPIVNYISNQNPVVSSSYALVVNQLFSISIPSNV